MTVADLVALLQTFDQSLPVVYRRRSDYTVLEPEEIETVVLCETRSDGWVENARPYKPVKTYLCLPGN